jgi:ATP-dependent helicase/DNAse subunit B
MHTIFTDYSTGHPMLALIYNSNSEGLRSGEMSRFITQMKYEQIIKPDILNLNFDIRTPVPIDDTVIRTDRHSSRLHSLYLEEGPNSVLSPTAINTWLNCRMRFYFRYVNGLREPEKSAGQVDHALFGRILHRLMKNVYEDYQGNEVSEWLIDSFLRNEKLSSESDR